MAAPAPRVLAAPAFGPAAGAPVEETEALQPHGQSDPQPTAQPAARVDFRTFTFPAMQNTWEFSLATYCGPTPESNWVVPGVLLVGAYPASNSDEETFDLISGILKCGITKFVCLQLEYVPNVSESAWRLGGALRPYFDDVKRIVHEKQKYPDLASDPSVVNESELQFEHCPIVDCGVTDDDKVIHLAETLVRDISVGKKIYLHCWGGHGRTGTVVSIMLHMMYGLEARLAMHRCQCAHDLRKCPVNVGSPQTQAQRDQVVRILAHLSAQYSPEPAAKERKQRSAISASLDFTSKFSSVSAAEPTRSGGGHKRSDQPSRLSFHALFDSFRGGAGSGAQRTDRKSGVPATPGVLPKFSHSVAEKGAVGAKVVEKAHPDPPIALPHQSTGLVLSHGFVAHAPTDPVSSSSAHPARRGNHLRVPVSSPGSPAASELQSTQLFQPVAGLDSNPLSPVDMGRPMSICMDGAEAEEHLRGLRSSLDEGGEHGLAHGSLHDALMEARRIVGMIDDEPPSASLQSASGDAAFSTPPSGPAQPSVEGP